MFTRTTLATAMVASVAVAQVETSFEVTVKPMGKEEDFNNKLTVQSAECQGSFNGDATQSFFFGVSHVEGTLHDQLVGWGRNLCANSADNIQFDTDYTVEVVVNGAAFSTGQRLVCDENLTGRMIKNFKNQVDDGAILRALVGYENDVTSGALTILDPNLSMQSAAKTKALEVVTEFESDQASWISTVEFQVKAALQGFYTDIQNTQGAQYDTDLQADLTAMEESIETFASANLNADALATWQASGTTIIDELMTLIQTEYETIKSSLLTNVDTAITTGETEAIAAAGTAQQTTTDEGA